MSSNVEKGTDEDRFWPLLDPVLAKALIGSPVEARTSIHPKDIQSRRAMLDPVSAMTASKLKSAADFYIDEFEIEGESRGSPAVKLALLRPKSPNGETACVYHIHGGGMILGDRYLGLERTLAWIVTAGVAVASVEYRLAPEHRYPAGLQDCITGLGWIATNAGELGIDPHRLVVAGASAGGALAAGMALSMRDHVGVPIAGLMLMSPMLDDRGRFPSSSKFTGQAPWDEISNRTGWEAALGRDAGSANVPCYAAPSRADRLSDLPPTYIDTGALDIFRDEDIDFATRLAHDGVPIELHVWGGAYHGFDLSAPNAAVSMACCAMRLNFLQRLVGRPQAGAA